MTKELENYYNNYFAMFRSEGWQQLISEFKANLAQVNSVEFTEDVNNLYFRKGQLNIIATLLNLENAINNAHDQAQNNNSEGGGFQDQHEGGLDFEEAV